MLMKLHDIKCYQILSGVVISILSDFQKFIQDETQSTVSADLGLQMTNPGRKIGLSRVFLASPMKTWVNEPKNRSKVPSSRQGLLAIGDTHHEACYSFAERCFHGLRLDLGVSTKPESAQMRKSNTQMTPDQSSPAEV